jgi:uncharacterized protein YqgC (DUF456 family)
LTEISQSALVLVGTPLMVLALVVSFIPILPGTVIVWLAAMAFGILDQWTQFTPAAGIICTAIMIFSVTSDFWLPALGMKTGGLTCLGAVGSLIGGFVGTFLIPLPICGTLIGAVAGALLAELVRFRDLRKAFAGGQTAAKMFVVGYILEAVCSIAVFVVYIVSVGNSG